MIVRAIDINNDWLFGKGRNDYFKDKFHDLNNFDKVQLKFVI